jgi:hypothetical protein
MPRTWKDDLNDALLAYVKANGHPQAVEVVDYDDSAYYSEGCSCYSNMDYTVDITYLTDLGLRKTFTYQGRFTELIAEIS